jgi:hypothetical protein
MKEELSKFTLYYKAKHSGRALFWDHSLGTATLKARFAPGIKELSVSLYQAAVLLLFNQSPQNSFQEIKDQTEMGKSFPALVRVYLINNLFSKILMNYEELCRVWLVERKKC